jgi:tetratricopeptide (TPR) repeat protein
MAYFLVQSAPFKINMPPRMSILCVLCFILVNLPAVAQREKLDSLMKILPIVKDSLRIQCLNNICGQFLESSYDTAYLYALLALDEARKIDYKGGVATAYLNLSDVSGRIGTNFPLTEKYCSLAMATFNELNNSYGYYHSVRLLAHALWAQSKFDLAVNRFNELIKLARQRNDKELEQKTHVWIGALEEQRGNYAKSAESLRNILELEKEKTSADSYRHALSAHIYNRIGDYENAIKSFRLTPNNPYDANYRLISMGYAFYQLKQYDSAILCFEKVRRDFATRISPNDSVSENDIQRWSNSRMGEIYFALNRLNTAEQYFTGALNAFENAHDLNPMMWVLPRLANTYISKKNYEQALKTSNKLLHVATKTGARQYVRDAHYLLYQIMTALKSNDVAYDHLNKYLGLKEILDQEMTSKNIYLLEASIELNKAQSRIDLLNSEKRIQQQEITIARQQKKYIIIGSMLAALVVLGLFRNITLKRKNERQLRKITEKELETQRSEAAKTKAELLHQAAELEMQSLRAQMNPHFIFNSLNAINRFILQSNKQEASQYLTKFSKLVRSILQNSMASSVDLEREIESLQLYLELEALRFNNRFRFKITVAPNVDITRVKVPPLLIQPFTENAIWHGLMQKDELGHLDINLIQENSQLILRITDDGVGRKRAEEIKSKSATRHKSLGLKITEDRIALLESPDSESSITINDLIHPDGSAAGTEVIIKIPLTYD